MRPNRPKPSKSELLAELESIRYTLSDEEIAELIQQEDLEIPVLEEPVVLPHETDEIPELNDETEAVTLTSMDAISDDDLIFDDSGPRSRDEKDVIYSRWSEEEDEDSGENLVSETYSAIFEESDAEPGRESEDADAEENVLSSFDDEDSPEAIITTMAEKSDFTESSTGQQSLFEQASTAGEEVKHADNENPFLPRHIRERLSQGRSTIMDELMQVGHSLNRDKSQFQRHASGPESEGPSHPTPMLHSSRQTDRIVEELVAEYLPRMEAELRKRLREQLSKPAGKVTDPETSI